MNIGETMQLGAFTVRCTIRFDNPAFPKYLIFKGDALVGIQFSVPCEADCRWHEVRKGQYAKQAESKKDPRWQLSIPKRGRPTNAERARRLAKEHLEAEAAELAA
jgi:hypothetical protein